MTTIMYGISNCDTIKKAKKHLENNNVDYQFHDYRKQGLDLALLTELEALFGWEAMVNKRGTTYRQLSDEQKQQLNKELAMTLMLESPALIKRPILRTDEHHLIGFKAAEYDAIFA
ncbi:ArsC family reductase [Pseudoalteromonas sp. T1lg76]|uniref:ArsC family reductase n=1 Tax=Pseudoalteromonas sp. T1lg76 TaxID=2077103 RepID=UPI000CF621C2|nr:ArsC family reductase [Pseudoalteromonas sp. T1lg76]